MIILTNDDEVYTPSLSSILLAVIDTGTLANFDNMQCERSVNNFTDSR